MYVLVFWRTYLGTCVGTAVGFVGIFVSSGACVYVSLEAIFCFCEMPGVSRITVWAFDCFVCNVACRYFAAPHSTLMYSICQHLKDLGFLHLT